MIRLWYLFHIYAKYTLCIPYILVYIYEIHNRQTVYTISCLGRPIYIIYTFSALGRHYLYMVPEETQARCHAEATEAAASVEFVASFASVD